MRADAPVQSHLHDLARVARRPHHRLALVDRVSRRLLDVHMRPGFDRRDRVQRMPVVRRRDDHHLRLLLVQQLAVILVALGRCAGQFAHLIEGRFQAVAIDVAHRYQFASF